MITQLKKKFADRAEREDTTHFSLRFFKLGLEVAPFFK